MASLPKPLAESYWVIPGRLLAGKYPGGKNLQELERRLGPILEAGFNAFIDLTEAGELPAYDDYLPSDVVHVRKPITDHGVPRDAAYMAEILAELDALLARGPVRVPALPRRHRPHRHGGGLPPDRAGTVAGMRRCSA